MKKQVKIPMHYLPALKTIYIRDSNRDSGYEAFKGASTKATLISLRIGLRFCCDESRIDEYHS